MPKHEPMTAKAIGKQIKSKGLQKLKYFCQMCQKQCRDANGFKCHISSEAHQRQLLLVAENPGQYLGGFSDEFLKDFLYLLKTRFGTRRVSANQVYQEYIKDRNHVHMNSTRWVTLTGFCKWMGRKGIATVEENEKGWFITWIDRDPETLKRQENLDKKRRLEKDYEERMAKTIEEQVERGKLTEKPVEPSEADAAPRELVRSEEDVKPVVFTLKAKKLEKSVIVKTEKSALETKPKLIELEKPVEGIRIKQETSGKRKMSEKESAKKTALEEIIQEDEKYKAKKFRRDNWLDVGIEVRIVANKLGSKYYQKKGVVRKLDSKYVGVVEMLDSGDKLKLDQEHLETVIPQVGREVKVVNGAYVGEIAILQDINFDKFCCRIKIDSGSGRGRVLDGIKYEDICKLH